VADETVLDEVEDGVVSGTACFASFIRTGGGDGQGLLRSSTLVLNASKCRAEVALHVRLSP
jgi:hypothetical protein